MPTLLLAGLLALLGQEPPLPGGLQEHLQLLSATPEKGAIAAGEVFRISFEIEIEQGWHIYPARKGQEVGKPTEFHFETGVPAEVAGDVGEPIPRKHDAAGEPSYEYHEGRITLQVPVRWKPEVASGKVGLRGHLEYQICNPKVCVNGKTPFSVEVNVTGGSSSPPLVPSSTPPPPAAPGRGDFVETGRWAGISTAEEFRTFLERGLSAEGTAAASPTTGSAGRGLWAFLLEAMSWGLFSLIMPCVFPLIPITVSYFAKQGEKKESSGAFLAALYALGIVVTFTGLGFGMSLLLGKAGARQFAANPYVNMVIAALFLYFSLALFGVVRLALPSGLTGGATSKRREGAGGAFILGCLFSVVTFTCTLPFAATVLARASEGEVFWPLFGMLAYSGTMAAPFLLLGLFPALVRKMPRGGGWMETAERTIGIIEIALALFYLSKADQVLGLGILTRPIMIRIWMVVFTVAALYLSFHLVREKKRTVLRWLVQGAFAVLFFALPPLVFLPGLRGETLGYFDTVLPAAVTVASHDSKGGLHVETWEEAQREARRTKRPIFLEFTGVT